MNRIAWQRWATVALLLIGFAQVSFAARRTSITLDEPLHITSGYACLLTGDYRLVEEHPPLIKMLQAAPLLLAQPRLRDPRTVPGWDEGNLIETARHVVVAYRPIEPLVFAARVPTMLVGMLLAALVLRWATDRFGANAGVLALTLCVFDPNILAHAGVATTDLGAACAIFAASYTFWRWLRYPTGPTPRRMIIAAVVLGLALGVKSTVIIVLPVFGLLILVARPAGQAIKPYLTQAMAAGVLAFVALWGLYRFEIGSVPGVPFPVPAPGHLLPLLKLQAHMREGHAAFLMGENYHHGNWRYFPVALALKTPPLTLIVLFLAVGKATADLRRASPELRRRILCNDLALSAFPLLYFGISLTSGINIGYRHLLPILPFIYIYAARITHIKLSPLPQWIQHLVRLTGVLWLGGYALTTLSIFPWHLAYFNFLAGGPDGGYRYLVDSNLDWGQTWIALREYLAEQGITDYGLSQYTINDPHAYGLDYTPLPPWPDAPPVLPQRFDPPPGIYAISTTQLQGVVVADSEMFDYFRKQIPVARIGHAMFVYRVVPHPPADWVIQCTMPVAPLPPDVLAEGLGRDDLRLVYADCDQSWLIPPGNGWLTMAKAVEGWGRTIPETQARLAYEQKQTGTAPPFELYEGFELQPTAGLAPTQAWTAPGDWPPRQVQTEGYPLTTPIAIGEALAYLGYTRDTTGITTYWQVVQMTAQPFSLMAHLLDATGHPIAVGDGSGVSIDQLRPGDTLIQHHRFEIPAGTPAGSYWIQVGAYTQPDIQRMPVAESPIAASDRLIVGEWEITPP